jgi:hypothetical protein
MEYLTGFVLMMVLFGVWHVAGVLLHRREMTALYDGEYFANTPAWFKQLHINTMSYDRQKAIQADLCAEGKHVPFAGTNKGGDIEDCFCQRCMKELSANDWEAFWGRKPK